MDKKSAKIIDSNTRNVTKALHVPKCDMCSKCEFASIQWNVLKYDVRPKTKECICFKTVKCSKMKLGIAKKLSLSINKGLMFNFWYQMEALIMWSKMLPPFFFNRLEWEDMNS